MKPFNLLIKIHTFPDSCFYTGKAKIFHFAVTKFAG